MYQAGSSGYVLLGTGSLYPEYIKSYSAYHCPNNSWFDTTGDKDFDKTNPKEYPVTAPLERYNAATIANKTDTNSARYYRYDCYDANPVILKNGTQPNDKIGAADGDWRVRYSRQWLPVQSDPTNLTGITETENQAVYSKQLIWSEPSDDTYLTMCSFHATKGKITVSPLAEAHGCWTRAGWLMTPRLSRPPTRSMHRMILICSASSRNGCFSVQARKKPPRSKPLRGGFALGEHLRGAGRRIGEKKGFAAHRAN